MKLSIYLIEDDLDFVSLLLQLLQSSLLFEVLGHATTLAEARKFLLTASPDVFLVDIMLPDGDSIELMQEIHSQYPRTKIIMLSTLGHEKYIIASLQAGASGYLLKSEMPSQIIQSILSVANDGGALGQHASRVVIEKLTQTSRFEKALTLSKPLVTPLELEMLQTPRNEVHQSSHIQLTARELEILKVVQNGAATKTVAVIFGISAFTVNQHLRNIYSKLGVRNKMEAVREAQHLGLL